MYFRLSKIYNSFKNYHISSNYQDFIKLFDLFALLIGITHIFVIIFLFRDVYFILHVS
jgi:hypothetical protein